MSFSLALACALLLGVALSFFLLRKRKGTKTEEQDSFEAHVLPHQGLRELWPGTLWVVQGSLPQPGPSFPRNMVIYKIPGSEDLILFSPIALSESSMEELLALGNIAYLLVPNSWHRLDVGVYAKRFPQALVVAPASAADAVRSIKLKVHGTSEELLPTIHSEIVVHELTPGKAEPLYQLPLFQDGKLEGYACVVADLFFNLPSGSAGFIADHILGSSGFFGVTRLGRLFLWLCIYRSPTSFCGDWR